MRYNIYKTLKHAKRYVKDDKVVFAKDVINKKGDIIKEYYVFNSLYWYKKYLRSINKEERNFYEIIYNVRRLYFDIDINIEDDNNYDYFIEDFKEHIVSYLLKINDLQPEINIYTSHIKTKKSYHIIVRNYYAEDYMQCKTYCLDIIDKYNKEEKKYIDRIVYKRNQLFRLLNNSKYGKGNIKIPYGHTSEELEDSLIIFVNKMIDNVVLKDIYKDEYKKSIHKQILEFNRL